MREFGTTVKTAIQEAFPVYKGINWIGDIIQAPDELLNQLESFISRPRQHKKERVK